MPMSGPGRSESVDQLRRLGSSPMKRITNHAFTCIRSAVRCLLLPATFLAIAWPAAAQTPAVTLTPVINTLSSNLGLPAGSAYDGAGHIYVTDTYRCELLKID